MGRGAQKLLSALIVTGLLVGGSAGARTARAATPMAAAALCPVFVGRIDNLDGIGTRYAIGLVTYGAAGSTSGSLAIYSNDLRYEVPFKDIRAVDPTDPHAKPQPLVIRFKQPVIIDAAVVDALGTPVKACPTPYQPWTKNGLAPVIGHELAARRGVSVDPAVVAPNDVFHEDALWKTFDADAARVTALDADDATLATTACSTGSERPVMVQAGDVDIPATFVGHTVIVAALVTIGSNGALISSAIVGSSGNRELDRNVLNAAKHGSFKGGRFRCVPAAGSYLFTVTVIA
jgi:TonB family protein